MATAWEMTVQCLYQNVMSNNFRKTTALKKIWIVKWKLPCLYAAACAGTTFYTLVCKNVSSCWLKFSGKIANKYMENLRQVSGEIWAQLRPQKFASRILCCVALGYNSYFFQNSRFTEISVDVNFSFFSLTESSRAITLAWKCLFTSRRFS